MELKNDQRMDNVETFTLELGDQIKIEKMDEIINEYKKQNNIDDLTEEEFTDIFQESVLYPYNYLPISNDAFHDGILVSDYELFLLSQGIDIGDGSTVTWLSKYQDYLMQTEDGYDLGDAECISYGVYEKSIAEDLEYYESLKTETIEVCTKDISEVFNLLNSNWDETTYCIRIHYNTGENKFLIIGYDESKFHYYKVCMETSDRKGDSLLFLGSCTDPKSIQNIIDLYLQLGISVGLSSASDSANFLLREDNPDIEIISEGRINLIMDLASQRYYDGKINLPIGQALMVMVSITHYFKFNMDYQKEWYGKHRDRMYKELEDFKKQEKITNWHEEIEWIIKNGALKYHICIPDLLLQTLYTLNGSYYRVNDRDYEWEEEFYDIFYDMPFGREFDMAMLNFLLLPLYNNTHGTNYKIKYCAPLNNDECTQ